MKKRKNKYWKYKYKLQLKSYMIKLALIPVGTELDVFYNPQNPDKSYVMRFVKNPAVKVLFFIGLLFIVLAFIGLAFLPK